MRIENPDLKTHTEEDLSEIRTVCARAGHTHWLSENSQKTLGYPKSHKVHPAKMSYYQLMAVTDRDLNSKEDLIDAFENVGIEIPSTLDTMPEEDVEKWISDLKNDFRHKNDNWADLGEFFMQKYVPNRVGEFSETVIENLSELRNAMRLFTDEMTDSIHKKIKLLTNDPALYEVLVSAHKGWREKEYRFKLPEEELEFPINLDPNDPLKMFMAQRLDRLESALSKGTLEDITDIINSIRVDAESDPKVSFQFTFNLMYEIGKAFESSVEKADSPERKAMLSDIFMNFSEYQIEADANAGVIQAILDLDKKKKEEQKVTTSSPLEPIQVPN